MSHRNCSLAQSVLLMITGAMLILSDFYPALKGMAVVVSFLCMIGAIGIVSLKHTVWRDEGK